jgi:hypothetical protein
MENKTYKQDSQITIKNTMPGNPPSMGSLLPIALLRIRSSPTKYQVSPLLKFFLGIYPL